LGLKATQLSALSNIVNRQTEIVMGTQKIEREAINSWDWNHAARYCQRYLTNRLYATRPTSHDEALAFSTAIIVTYGRPFSGNRDRAGKRDPVDERYINALSPTERDVHDQIIDLRNSMFAHSDASAHNVQVTNTTSGGLVTFSQDRLAPLEKMVVECLLANLQKFNVANEELRRDAVARHLSKGSSSEEETT
jgi:hypothetical protein